MPINYTMRLPMALKLVLVALVAVSLCFIVFGPRRLVEDPDDFRGFYCAGSAVLQRADPYLAEPLRSCEYRYTSEAGLSGYRDLALPAPLPGFAFAPLAIFAMLPFTQANNLFSLLILTAMVITAVMTSRLTGFPIIPCIAALVISDGTIDVLNGQIFPFALLALVASAIAISRDRPIAASIFAALAAIEPHIALPALAALAWTLPRTRIPLLCSLLSLGVIALVAIGLPANLEYLFRVLPAHAKSEAYSLIGQYSLTTVLVELGVARDTAIALANAQYAAMCVLGCVLARKLGERASAAELLVLVPPAVAVFGGPFLHLTQIAVAIPATIALAMRFPRYRTAYGIVLLLIAPSWQDLVENGTPAVVVTLIVIATAIATALWPRSWKYSAIAVTATLVLGLIERAIRLSDHALRGNPGHALALVSGPKELAEASWTAYVTSAQFGDPRHHLASHLPMWVALLVLIATMSVMVFKPSLEEDSARYAPASH